MLEPVEEDELRSILTSSDDARAKWAELDDEDRQLLWSWVVAPRWRRTRRGRAERAHDTLRFGPAPVPNGGMGPF